MDFSHTAEDEAFRAELVEWLDEHLPKFLAAWAEEQGDDAAGVSVAGVLGQMERRRAWPRTLN